MKVSKSRARKHKTATAKFVPNFIIHSFVSDDEEDLEDAEDPQNLGQIKKLEDDDDDSDNDDQVSIEDTIDMDAVEEINKIIADTKKQEFVYEDVAGPSRSFSNVNLE